MRVFIRSSCFYLVAIAFGFGIYDCLNDPHVGTLLGLAGEMAAGTFGWCALGRKTS